MVIRKTMSNVEIYNTASALADLFNSMVDNGIALPVKANFYFQKNMNTLVAMGKELEEERSNIIQKFGTPSEEDPNQITLSPENLELANKELNELFGLEQEVAVNVIELDWFGDVNLTPQQFAAITFMIKDEE